MTELPPAEQMYAALCARDATYEGLFFAGVRTTGVFCRPTCPARKPRLENIEFFTSAEAAQGAGFRPCLRCRPVDPAGVHPPWAVGLIERIDSGESDRISDKDLRRLGIEPARARRYFQVAFGATFQVYQRARRVGLAWADLHDGEPLDGVVAGSGYGSASGFRSAFAEIFGESPGRSRQADALVGAVVGSPIGPVVLAASRQGLCLLEFADRRALKTEIASLRQRFGRPVIPGLNEHLQAAEGELERYFRGECRRFAVPLDLRGTPFQESVWRRLLEIPYGETATYEEIACSLKRSGAQRAVGRANGQNRIAIAVPCHRVIQKDGTLCGYGGGLWRKRFLLDHERAVCARAAGDRGSIATPRSVEDANSGGIRAPRTRPLAVRGK